MTGLMILKGSDVCDNVGAIVMGRPGLKVHELNRLGNDCVDGDPAGR